MKRLLLVFAALSGLLTAGCPDSADPSSSSPKGNITAAFNGLTADGSASATTSKLTLNFDKDITGLAAADITLNTGSTGAVKGALTKAAGTGVYELALIGITQGGTVSVSVTKSGYTISGSPKTAMVYYYYSNGGGNISAVFNSLAANGSASATTTTLTLNFDKDITGLAAADITLNTGNTGAVKGALTKAAGTGVYELALIGITQGGTVTVSVTKSGYTISGSPKTATVYYYYSNGGGNISAVFNSLIADGSASATTSKLTLNFDKDITGLAAADITLNTGNTGAVKGALTKAAGTGVYELALIGITQGGTVTVSVTKSGYTISGSPKTATVYYYYSNGGTAALTLTFAQISDAAPVLTGPTLYRVTNNGPTTATLTVDNPSQYSNITWRVDNTAVTANGASFILDAANNAYNTVVDHFVTVMVMKDGAPYNKTVSFKIEY